jgi:hypothetical protein
MLRALHLQHLDPAGPQVASEPRPVAAGAFYPGATHGAEALRPAEELLVTLHGRWHAGDAQASLPRWSTATATWKSRCVSTPRITATSVSGLSASIVVTFAQLLSMSRSLPPEEQERTDGTVRGHVTGEFLLGHDAPAPGGRRATPRCPADESLARRPWLTWKEGQAAPRRRPQPFSRILIAWKWNSWKFARTSN